MYKLAGGARAAVRLDVPVFDGGGIGVPTRLGLGHLLLGGLALGGLAGLALRGGLLLGRLLRGLALRGLLGG